MKIKILHDNIIYRLQKKGGVSRYWREITSRMPKDNVLNVESSSLMKTVMNMPPIKIRDSEKYVFHSSYYRCFSGSSIKSVLTIHDFMPEKYWSGFSLLKHKFMKRIALKRCSYIVFINKHLRDEFVYFYPEFSSIPYCVIKHGNTFELERYKESDSDYYAYVGSIGEAKNFKFILDYLSNNKDKRLKCVGFSTEQLEEYCNRHGHDFVQFKNIDVLGMISDDELKNVIRKSIALLIPSIDEGFGLPVIEAVSLGVPVLASDIPSFRELLPRNYLLNLDELDKSYSFINRLASNDEFRKAMFHEQQESIKHLSWDKAAEEYRSVYSKVWR